MAGGLGDKLTTLYHLQMLAEREKAELDEMDDKISNLADDVTLEYKTATKDLAIKGYTAATQGQMLIKDTTAGVAWATPVSDATLQAAVTQAQASATQAGTYAVQAGNAAASALETLEEVENKLWFGTMAQYNALTTIDPESIYVIVDGTFISS